MKSLAALPLIVLLALAARVGYAASFDCEKASNKAEILVCGVPELSSLDVRLSQLYSKARKSQSTTSTLRDDQRAWLKQRNLCVDLVCLTSSYQQRIAELVALPALQRGAAPSAQAVPRSGAPQTSTPRAGSIAYFNMDGATHRFDSLPGYCALEDAGREGELMRTLPAHPMGPDLDLVHLSAPCRDIEQFRAMKSDVLPRLFLVKKSRVKAPLTRERFLQASLEAAQGDLSRKAGQIDDVLRSAEAGMKFEYMLSLGRDEKANYLKNSFITEFEGFGKLTGYSASTLWQDYGVVVAFYLVENLRSGETFNGNIRGFQSAIHSFLAASDR